MALPTLKIYILKFNQYMKSEKSPRIIYLDLKKQTFSTTKVGDHILGDIQCKLYGSLIVWKISKVYILEKVYEKFCIPLREHPADLINFEKKKMLRLTEEELKSHQNAIQCYICIKKSKKIKVIKNLETITILLVNIEVQHIIYITISLIRPMKFL